MSTNWILSDFWDFILKSDRTMDLDPAFGISYKLNNKSNFLNMEKNATIYNLNSDNNNSDCIDFINDINRTLNEASLNPTKIDEFKFNLKLATISEMFNKPDTFLYIQAGLNREFYEKNKSSKEIAPMIDNLAKSILNESLKENRKPHEVIFSYNFLGLLPSQQLTEKILRGEKLEEFLKKIKNK